MRAGTTWQVVQQPADPSHLSQAEAKALESSLQQRSMRSESRRCAKPGKIPVSKEPDRVRYEFAGFAKLAHMNYRQLRGLEKARKLVEKYDGKGERRGMDGVKEGRVSKRKLVRDKDKPKRKYTFKNGKPTNPRK